MKHLILFVCITCFLTKNLHSQICDEKLFLHTDRITYVAGESIWFKAYVYTKFAPDEVATILRIELLTIGDSIIVSNIFPISNGVAYGSIDLKNRVKQGNYILHAYVSHLEPDSLSAEGFSKMVYVFNPFELNDSDVSMGDNVVSAPQIYFYPNSGKLIEGLRNKVFFYSVDENKLPTYVHGNIINSNNDLIGSFSSTWSGYGYFEFTPQKGENYAAKIYFEKNQKKISKIGEQVTDGVIVNTLVSEKSMKVLLEKPLNNGHQIATVIGIVNNNLIFKKQFNFDLGSYSFSFPIDELPSTSLDIVVFNQDDQIYGFKSVFVHQEGIFVPIRLIVDSLNFSKGGANVFSVQIPDSTLCNVSISVTDLDLAYPFPEATIFSQLILRKNVQPLLELQDIDVVGKLGEKIDLLLNTSSGFIEQWSRLYKNVSSPCVVVDTNFISITGKVYYKKNGKIVSDGELNILFSGADSTYSIILVPIEKNGSFKINNLYYQGIGKFQYSLNNKTKEIIVHLDSSGMMTRSKPFFSNKLFIPNYNKVRKDTAMNSFLTKRYEALNNSFMGNTTLAPVTVTKKLRRPVEQVNNKYSKGLFASMNYGRSIDLINNPPPPMGGNILDYLQSKVIGLIITKGNGLSYTLSDTRGRAISSGSGAGSAGSVRVFLDEIETTVDFLTAILPKDVAFVKYIPAGNARFSGIGMAGVLAIYIRKPDDYLEQRNLDFPFFTFQGFNNNKKFDTEIHRGKTENNVDDPTLYWNPEILLDATKQKFSVRFKNVNGSQRMHLKVQGYAPDGKLVYIDKVIK